MATEQITLELRIVGKGNQPTQIRTLTGDVNKLNSALTNMAGKGLSLSNQQLTNLKQRLQQASSAASQAGQQLTKVRATLGGAGGDSLTARSKERGIGKAQSPLGQIFDKNTVRAGFATAGFLSLGLSQQLSTVLDPVKFTGLIAPNIQRIGEIVGSLFGQTFGSIFSDVAKSLGEFIESLADSIVAPFRILVKSVFGGFGTALATGLITAGFAPGLNAILAITVGTMTAVATAITEALREGFNIVAGVFRAITSLISAALKSIKAVFDGFVRVVTALWKGFWEFIKSTAEAAMKITLGIIDQLSKGFMQLVESERTAFKGAVQVEDVFTEMNKTLGEGAEQVRQLQNALRIDYGIGQAQSASGVYFAL